MRAVITLANPDGSIGTSRMPLGPYRLEATIERIARDLAKGRAHQIEYFTDDAWQHSADPYKVSLRRGNAEVVPQN